MANEIERKFLVTGPYRHLVHLSVRIRQGYLCSHPERTVRIRLRGAEAFLTIKGASSTDGTTRYEWENAIDPAEANELFALCLPGSIDKTRHLVQQGPWLWEVDEFHADNRGLVVAEIELPTADTHFELPPWVGPELTGQARYYNSALSQHPYALWADKPL